MGIESPQGPLFKNLRYCLRCCVPETEEGMSFDEMGMCQSCQSSEQKMHIDWTVREKKLRNLLEDAKAKAGNNYDCIVPISGGKDSTFQLHVLVKVYNMKPLAVTFNHNWYNEIGWYNLQNALEKFNVDHIMFTPNRKLVNRLAKSSLGAIGDACWHCHAGVGAFPLQVAVNFKIPLLIWGESIAEASGRATYNDPKIVFDREYFTRVSAKKTAKQMVDEDLSEKDLAPFEIPSSESCEAVGVHGIHLGDYIFWDDERQMEFVKRTYEWKEVNIEGTYKRYKSAECVLPGMHDFTKYLKRGFGRATDHACIDVRNGLLSRSEGFKLAKKYDTQEPNALKYYLKITGMTEKEFYEAMKKHRVSQLQDIDLPISKDKKKEEVEPFVQTFLKRIRKEYPDNE
ncbi:N-acetyl sugar amidotransferase [Candidatus Babeliales bacterium]|nr:N-acetyl sugar amidotransferase [Candidatus Babeliales bacterium]